MNDPLPPDLQPDLLDDFYTECDELFGQMRTQVSALRARSAEATSEPLQALFRTMHSFKGICGIVGLRAAEEVAHAAEDILRRITRGQATLTAEAVDLFALSAHHLEQIVGAHRTHQPLPSTAEVLATLKAHIAPPGAAPAAGTKPHEPSAGLAVSWRVNFSPSTELTQRGVNVTAIRERLAALGPIKSATPAIRSDGTMVFEFHVELSAPPADLEAWRHDGVTFEPATLPAPGPKPSSDNKAGGVDALTPAAAAPSHLVRVDLSRLDDLMRIMGEMVIHRSRLEERISHVSGDRAPLQEVNLALARSLRDLRAGLVRVRLVPVGEVFSRLPFLVRDLERESGKKIRLVLEGEETEVDKFLVERMREPLLHLVRNAVSHGIEDPAERTAAGKPEEATLLLRAVAAGHSVVIQVRDDGRGVDIAKVTQRAAELGFPLPEQPSTADVLAVLCRSGFSTREEADRTSGRGVGMSVVHATVRELGGLLTLDSEPGRSTCFTLRLPLTLSIADAVIATCGGQTCAVPQSALEEVIQFEERDVHPVKGVDVIPYRGGLLPLTRLATILGETPLTKERIPALVVASERGLAGLAVDRVVAQREIVVRPMSDPLLQVSGITGATELGDGRPVLILEPSALTNGAVRPRAAGRTANSEQISPRSGTVNSARRPAS